MFSCGAAKQEVEEIREQSKLEVQAESAQYLVQLRDDVQEALETVIQGLDNADSNEDWIIELRKIVQEKKEELEKQMENILNDEAVILAPQLTIIDEECDNRLEQIEEIHHESHDQDPPKPNSGCEGHGPEPQGGLTNIDDWWLEEQSESGNNEGGGGNNNKKLYLKL